MADFQLEHFYHGQAVQNDKPAETMTLLAASDGITPSLVQQAVARVRIPPLIRSANSAWALVRGKSREMPFIMVQAQQGEAGQIVLHYIILRPDALRAQGGNLDALRGLLDEAMPVFNGDEPAQLQPLTMAQAAPLTVEAQVDHILELMTITQNRVQTIERLLAAIIQGSTLVIQGAPASLDDRVMFIQGLLALLPGSARFGVTFTTHSQPSSEVDVQIQFYSDDVPPAESTVFNWGTSKVGGVEVKDAYSRYVMSQLRLDTELVIQQNMAMASIAGWRLNQGDSLATALGYASSRLRMDNALRNNQPVSKNDVARILTEDPTLSTDLQVMYALHLIKLALAMRDMEPAAPVAILLRGNDRLERAVLDEIDNALDVDTAGLVQQTLIRWMNNPLGPQGFRWVDLAHRSILLHLRNLVQAREADSILAMLKTLQDAALTLQIDDLAPKVIKLVLPMGYRDARVAENLFLLGMRFLADDPFRQLMSMERLRAQLNPQIAKAWSAIAGDGDEEFDAAALLRVARQYGERWEPLILLRFADNARQMERYNLLDADTLKALAVLAKSADASEYAPRLRQIAQAVESEALTTLRQPGPRYLLEIYLALGEYELLARGLIQQLRQLYPVDEQEDFLLMAGSLFAETTIPASRVVTALDQINAAGVRSTPYIVVATSAIQNHRGAPEVVDIADEMTELITTNRHVVDLVPPAALMGLLEHYAIRRDLSGLRRIASVIPNATRGQGRAGVSHLVQTYQKLDWSKEARMVGLEVLRASLRMQRPDTTRRMVSFYTKQIGSEIRRPLEVTYYIQRLIGHQDVLDYGEDLHQLVGFFLSMAVLYADDRGIPPVKMLQEGLASLSGAAGLDDRFFNNITATGKGIIALAKQHRSARRQGTKALLSGQNDPTSTLDVMRIFSGGFVDGTRFNLKIEPKMTRYPMQDFSVGEFIKKFALARRIIQPLAEGLPLSKPPRLRARDILSEARSIDRAIELEDKNIILRNMARDLQYLIDFIVIFYEQSDSKAFENSGVARRIDAGKHRPEGVLELMRFIYGYYRQGG